MNKGLMASALMGALALAGIAWAEPEGPTTREAREPHPMRAQGGDLGEPGQPWNESQRRERILRAVVQNPELAAAVGLKEEQVKAIREAAFAHREKMVKLRSQAELARMQVEKLMSAERVDREAVLKAVDEAGAQEVAIKKAEIAFQLDMKQLVGEDVAQKIREGIKDRIEERRPPPGAERAPGRRRAAGEPRSQERPDPPPPPADNN